METKTHRSNYDAQVDIGRQIFLEYDQEQLIRKYDLETDEHHIFLAYLNTPCRISRTTGQIDEWCESSWRECRNFGTVMTVYDLLCYHRGTVAPVLAHQWCTVGTFVVTGVTDTGTFTKKYAGLFDGNTDKLCAACEALGGVPEPGRVRADVSYRIPVTKFFPVLLQFWEGDEEFPPKLQLMWDRNAMDYLHFETTFYLQGDLAERLSQTMG